ncbi:MAG: NAD(P) transhydrogenase subunit alpha [Actinomycetota bacterium]
MLTTYLLIFILATFIGLEVIKRVSPLLHTPLMSLTNAISAISLVGSIELTGRASVAHDQFSVVLGTIAIAASFANVVGGFVITDRMLKMFKKREPAKAGAGAVTGGK